MVKAFARRVEIASVRRSYDLKFILRWRIRYRHAIRAEAVYGRCVKLVLNC